jgi:uncharacterized protein (TIGR00730 family)
MFLWRIQEYIKFLRSLILTNKNLMLGMWRLTKIPRPAITFFGGARIKADDKYSVDAERLAKRLTLKGFSIITGGGGGIMEAANRGASEAIAEIGGSKSKLEAVASVGIGIIGLSGEKKNRYLDDYIPMYHFFSRKWLMTRYAAGFVVFPGGFGTMDEMFEILTLIQCHKMEQRNIPVVLMETKYWHLVIEWAKRVQELGFLGPDDLNLLFMTDDIDEAFAKIMDSCEKLLHQKRITRNYDQ